MGEIIWASDQEIAEQTASMLLEIGAVHFNAQEPFILASGKPSPTYIDCRKLIGFPKLRRVLMGFMAAKLLRGAGFDAIDRIAGGETAGIPFAAYLSEILDLPMAYIRKKPKGYGRNARIEGPMAEGDRVLLVEDLTTDGGSKLSFVHAIRETGAECAHISVVFSYGIFPQLEGVLAKEKLSLHALCDWADVLDIARKQKAFDENTLNEVTSFLADPETWHEARL